MKSVITCIALAISAPAFAYDDHDRAHQQFLEQMDRQRELQIQQQMLNEMQRQNDNAERAERQNNSFGSGGIKGFSSDNDD
jgi:hypothetical protein